MKPTNKFIKNSLGIAVLGLLWCSVGFAEWTLISTTTIDDKFYIDKETLKKKDGNRYIWILADYNKPLSDGTKSSKQLLQIDCELDRFKMIDAITYKDQMGDGDLNRLDISNPKWNWVTPESTWASITKKVCKW